MNWVDIAILIISFIGAIMFLKMGLIGSVFSIAGLLVGIVVGGRYHSFLGDSAVAEIAAYAVVVIAAMIVASIISNILRKILGLVMLGWVDKLGGFVLGALVGALLSAAILTIIVKTTYSVPTIPGVPIPQLSGLQQVISSSTIAPILMERFPLILSLLPGDYGNLIRDFFTR